MLKNNKKRSIVSVKKLNVCRKLLRMNANTKNNRTDSEENLKKQNDSSTNKNNKDSSNNK